MDSKENATVELDETVDESDIDYGSEEGMLSKDGSIYCPMFLLLNAESFLYFLFVRSMYV